MSELGIVLILSLSGAVNVRVHIGIPKLEGYLISKEGNQMPEKVYPSYTLYEVRAFAQVRDAYEVVFLEKLKEADRIADNMRDVWKSQRCGAER